MWIERATELLALANGKLADELKRLADTPPTGMAALEAWDALTKPLHLDESYRPHRHARDFVPSLVGDAVERLVAQLAVNVSAALDAGLNLPDDLLFADATLGKDRIANAGCWRVVLLDAKKRTWPERSVPALPADHPLRSFPSWQLADGCAAVAIGGEVVMPFYRLSAIRKLTAPLADSQRREREEEARAKDIERERLTAQAAELERAAAGLRAKAGAA